MRRIRAVFRSVNSKIALIISAAVLGSFALLLFGAFYIEALMVIWNLAFVAAVVVWERYRRSSALNSQREPAFSDDERWSRIKRDIERVEGRLEKTRDSEKRKALLHQKHYLENELRRAEWSIKESNLNGMYNAGTGNLRKLGPNRKPPRDGEDESIPIDPLDKYTPEGALRERRRLEKQAEERRSLERIIDNAQAVLRSEPPDSVVAALRPVANEFRAHYYVLRKRKNSQDSRSDYWVAWAVISSIMNGVAVDKKIVKYASSDLRPKFKKMIKLAESLHLQRNSLRSRRKESPDDSEGMAFDDNTENFRDGDEKKENVQ